MEEQPTTANKPNQKEKLWALAQTPFGIWILSTFAVGLFGWGYAQVASKLVQSRAKSTVIAHADAEAKSRLEQWVNMSGVRWTRRKYSWKFDDFYFKLINSPDAHPTHGDSIYPAYSEYANSALISVLIQLRDNVRHKDTGEIDSAVSWVSVWNPDSWTEKTFRQAVEMTMDHLWLSRWGNRPIAPSVPLYNIVIGGGLANPQLRFLSAVHPNDGSRKDKDGLFIFSADDGSGRQKWEIETDASKVSRIRIASGIEDDGDFLSTTIDGELVDLYYVDDKSGRQRWIIEDGPNGFKHIRISKGVFGPLQYLSASPDGAHLSLADADDASGRQRWEIEPIK